VFRQILKLGSQSFYLFEGQIAHAPERSEFPHRIIGVREHP
jgi:hypothetical protein